MRAPMELTVRRLLADHLGVGVEELVSEVSLRDDLAADSLDLVELAMALEAAFAIEVPQPILEHVRSFGDLIRATDLLIGARCEAESRGAESPTRIWARIVPGADRPGGTVERTAWLTPYVAETIAEDAVRAGRVTRVWDQFARLRHHGIPVSIRDGSGSTATPVRSVADRVAERHRVAAASGYSNGA